jgi:hypothetical protein
MLFHSFKQILKGWTIVSRDTYENEDGSCLQIVKSTATFRMREALGKGE